MNYQRLVIKTLIALLLLPLAARAAAEMSSVDGNLDRWNVVWDSPSTDAHGSMPIGNGDVGINAWVEPSGDLVFYVSKTDAWDENGRLCKVGRVRLKFDPPLVTTNRFRQELKLRDGVIEIKTQAASRDVQIRLWVDANSPVVNVEADCDAPVNCRAEVEIWRQRERPFGPDDDGHSGAGLSAQSFKPTVLPDAVVASAEPRIVWYHRNTRSIFPLCLQVQHLESLKDRFADPLLNHTFGASMVAEGMIRDGDRALKSATPSQHHRLVVSALAERAAAPEVWLKDLSTIEPARTKESRDRTARWWNEFWNRSWIVVEREHASYAIPANAHPVALGADPHGGNQFRGSIASPAIHDRVLGAAELSERNPPGDPVAITKTFAPATNAWPNGITLEAFVKPVSGEHGRIFDKSTPTQGDGFLFDTHPGLALRLIIGQETMVVPNCLKAGAWQHVVATFDPNDGARKVYLNGNLIAHEGGGSDSPSPLTQGYVLQRFMNACSGRGAAPIKFNGSIFTVEAKPGASPETPDGDPDWRRWGGNYWFQNTRLAYWPMLAAGDFDMMQPWFRMYRDALPLSQARIETYYKFQNAAQFPETMYWWGLPNNGDYGWKNTAPEPANSYIRRYWNGSLELTAIMLDRYDYVQDEQFARDTLIPLADPLISFLDQYWQKRDVNGKVRFDPAQSLETWHVAVNPLPEIAGLRFLLPRLLALPETVTTKEQRSRWTRILGELPPIPVAEVNGKRLLRPAETFSAHSNSENTELYAVFPYRLFGIGRPDLEMARAAFGARANHHNRGWCQDSIQAACLGLGDEAGSMVVGRAAQINRGYRFPAMWGPNSDWIPDQDHGNNILTTLQYMLLQSDGDKIYPLPAWPKTWNVTFRLHAPRCTTVECSYKRGKIETLLVTPTDRAKDVILPNLVKP